MEQKEHVNNNFNKHLQKKDKVQNIVQYENTITVILT